QYMQYGYWKVRVIQKHKVPASMRHLVPGGFLALLLASALGSVIWPSVLWGLLALVGLYVLCAVVAAGSTAARLGWQFFPLLPVVFACYHFSYGCGFLHGLWDFVILRRGPSSAYTKLTRPPQTHKVS